MSKLKARLMTAAVIAIALPVYAGVGAAAPISGTLAIQNAAPSNVQDVRYYGGGWRGGGWRGGGWGRGWGWGGVGAGLAAGAIIGGALACTLLLRWWLLRWRPLLCEPLLRARARAWLLR